MPHPGPQPTFCGDTINTVRSKLDGSLKGPIPMSSNIPYQINNYFSPLAPSTLPLFWLLKLTACLLTKLMPVFSTWHNKFMTHSFYLHFTAFHLLKTQGLANQNLLYFPNWPFKHVLEQNHKNMEVIIEWNTKWKDRKHLEASCQYKSAFYNELSKILHNTCWNALSKPVTSPWIPCLTLKRFYCWEIFSWYWPQILL